MKILITGGAGYIGSCVNAWLNKYGYETVVFDNLIYGHKQALDVAPLSEFIKADLNDKNAIKAVFESHKIQAVLHFAAYAYVGESVENPAKYYRNNVANSLNLLESMLEAGVKHIVFSSTCAIYGNPLELPINESHRKNPINPYGRSKLMIEQILEDFSTAYHVCYVALRYFNASGASREFNIGESHSPETHLIPLVIKAALRENRNLEIFGDDYPTRDGSCVRDYIHIDDLAKAHILALEYLLKGGKSEVFNLGNGAGFSNFEVLKAAQHIAKKDITYKISPRRAGDPDTLIGSCQKAKEILGFECEIKTIEEILQSAFKWHKNPRY